MSFEGDNNLEQEMKAKANEKYTSFDELANSLPDGKHKEAVKESIRKFRGDNDKKWD